ncbi:MAG TPA: TOBE domain-containing protein [Caulobacteraceae bacterium]|nr:TOBE domain-containing protein [Caulobacteraceae bacterium]
MADEPLSSSLTVGRGRQGRIGADRIALVEAIDREGSISRAGRALGLSYRAAWDAVQALNNLFDEPLIEAAPGGAHGGAALVTARGRRLAQAYRKMESRLARAWVGIEADSADLWSLGMKTSARNALGGVVESITDGAVNTEVTLRVAEGASITSVVTRASVEELGLAVGAPAIALIKSSFVILATGSTPLRTSARNQLIGKVISREDGAVNSEIVLEIEGGKTLAATLTLESARALELKIGEVAIALIKAPHVILAVE